MYSDIAKCLQGATINSIENHGSGILSGVFSKGISKIGIKLAGFYIPSYQNGSISLYFHMGGEMLLRSCTQVNLRKKKVQKPTFEYKWNSEARDATSSLPWRNLTEAWKYQ